LRLLAVSSVWIDLLRGRDNAGTAALTRALNDHQVLVGDLILAEVLRGVAEESLARRLAASFAAFETVELCGLRVALAAAKNHRLLRARGIAVRGTIDLIIGTWCIFNGVPLIHADRDFAGMESHLGFKGWSGLE
jgi:hypothetical protein